MKRTYPTPGSGLIDDYSTLVDC